MCERDCFKYDNFILAPLNDNYIKMFFMKQLIKNVLLKIEKNIKLEINNINDYENFKKYLGSNIGKIYEEQIIPYT